MLCCTILPKWVSISCAELMTETIRPKHDFVLIETFIKKSVTEDISVVYCCVINIYPCILVNIGINLPRKACTFDAQTNIAVNQTYISL
jgi:hypothetical protein